MLIIESREKQKVKQKNKKNSSIIPFRDNKHLHFRKVLLNPGGILPPQGNIWQGVETFLVLNTGRWYYCHLVG